MKNIINIPGHLRRSLSVFIMLCLLIGPILLPMSASGESTPIPTATDSSTVAEDVDAEDTMASADLPITAKSAVLIDNHTGRILYEKNKDKELVPASITKIMTLLLIFEAIEQDSCKLEDIVTVSEYAASMGGSQVFLEPGENQTVEDMIKCISIASANDAAVAMAEHIAGSEGAFVKRMNKKAQELGMVHTHFKNCNGLDDSIKSGHFSSAYDVALMSKELMSKYPDISKYSTVWMDTIIHKTKKGEKEFGLTNTNKLIRTYNGITGLKTGSTSKAKYCLSATASRDGVSLTAVVMAAPDHRVRFTQAAALLDYGFANCTSYEEKPEDIPLESQKIAGGITESVTPRIEKSFQYVLCGEEQTTPPKRKITYKKNLTAPVKEGDQIGTVTYYLDDKEIGTLPIVAAETVKKAHYPDVFLKILRNLMACKE